MCRTYTDATGKYVINLTELAAPSGSQWDLYFIKEAVANPTAAHHFPPYFARVYSGVFVVSGVVTKNFAMTPQ